MSDKREELKELREELEEARNGEREAAELACDERLRRKSAEAERDKYRAAVGFYAQNFVDNGVRARNALTPQEDSSGVCERCHGKGGYRVEDARGDGHWISPCTLCGKEGSQYPKLKKCEECGGSGEVFGETCVCVHGQPHNPGDGEKEAKPITEGGPPLTDEELQTAMSAQPTKDKDCESVCLLCCGVGEIDVKHVGGVCFMRIPCPSCQPPKREK